MLIDEMEITWYQEGGRTILSAGFSINVRQAIDPALSDSLRFDVEEQVKQQMRHKVRKELYKVFLENARAELENKHMYPMDKRFGSAILEHPMVEKGSPLMLVHPEDWAKILGHYRLLDDILEWKKGEFTK